MKTNLFLQLHRPLVKVFLGVLGLFLLIWGMMAWHKAQQAKIGVELTPEDVVQVFQNAEIETRELTNEVYYPAGYSGEYGLAFTSTIESKTYHILVALYTNWEEAQYVARGVNDLNESMKGGHASAFHYGPIFVQIYPSDKRIADKLQATLNAIE